MTEYNRRSVTKRIQKLYKAFYLFIAFLLFAPFIAQFIDCLFQYWSSYAVFFVVSLLCYLRVRKYHGPRGNSSIRYNSLERVPAEEGSENIQIEEIENWRRYQ